MKIAKLFAVLLVLLFSASFHACSKSSSSSGIVTDTPSGNAPSGTLSVLVSDAPGDFDNAYITVKDIWFHTSTTAGPHEAGWVKKPLSSPVTVDLLTLANGNMQSLWSGVTLSIGDYQQIRLVLADTDDPLTVSATASHLSYNNEIIINNVEYPLNIPDSVHGILLVGHFKITEGGTLRLAIDFDAGNDILELKHGDEYVLKPRLRYFDLDNAGAIIGKLSTGPTFTPGPRFVIKAEALSGDGTYHIVHRWTTPKTDGSFIIYPVSAVTISTYDVLVRGLNYQTVVIKGVPVTKGTTTKTGTDLGAVLMTAAATPDYTANATIASPTGAWLNFYQTLPGTGEVPYEVRFRHFFPLTGKFDSYPLSNMPILVGSYGTAISLATTTPVEGVGKYQVVADAILYNRSAWGTMVSSATPTVTIAPLSVQSPWTGNTIAGNIKMNNPTKMNGAMDNGIVFAVHGGMIVNAVDVGTQMNVGGTYSMPNMPGGTIAKPLPNAFYGMEAFGWQALHPRLHRAFAVPAIADIRTGDDTNVDMNMLPALLWP